MQMFLFFKLETQCRFTGWYAVLYSQSHLKVPPCTFVSLLLFTWDNYSIVVAKVYLAIDTSSWSVTNALFSVFLIFYYNSVKVYIEDFI